MIRMKTYLAKENQGNYYHENKANSYLSGEERSS